MYEYKFTYLYFSPQPGGKGPSGSFSAESIEA